MWNFLTIEKQHINNCEFYKLTTYDPSELLHKIR